MQSLADFLGVQDGQEPVRQEPGPRLEDISDPKEFAEAVLNSREFRNYIVNGLILGNVAGFASILIRIMDLAGWQKPPERVEVKDVTDQLEDFTAEQCEERATRLLEVARRLRAPDAKESNSTSVH